MGGRSFLQQNFFLRIFRKTFFFALFLACMGVGLLNAPLTKAEDSSSVGEASIVFDTHSDGSIFDGNYDQCVVFENYTLSQGKKKPVLNRLVKKRRVNIPSSVEAPEPVSITSPTPEVFSFVSEQDFSSAAWQVSHCPRAP